MTEISRWDAEMLRFTREMEAAAALDPQPDPRRDVAGARAWTERMNLPLAAGGDAMAESRDVTLPTAAGPVRCRLHRPVREAGLPVLVFVHGGGWVWNSVDTHDRLLRAYAAAAGCAVVSPDYALSPEAVFPRALHEVAGVIRHLAAEGASLGLDGSRIVAGGDSAGANLALAAALLLRDEAPALALQGLLLNYGCFDANCDTASYAEFAEGYGLTRARMRMFWEMYAPDPAERLGPLASPGLASLHDLPPVLLHIAELDVLRDDSEAIEQRLLDAGVAVERHLFPGVVHGFLRAQGRVSKAGESVREAGAWLRARFGTPGA
ncbi:alpha/beta hydrolase fold domain-containing protein [Roseomonas elaeocarpi]|uniref:Alpha/beta hydrolase fold domain-containing protein n=1 Tax=Roseomonas elaeocarpi TaxID=907779 RepID=A0ABV6JXN5_9PROT